MGAQFVVSSGKENALIELSPIRKLRKKKSLVPLNPFINDEFITDATI